MGRNKRHRREILFSTIGNFDRLAAMPSDEGDYIHRRNVRLLSALIDDLRDLITHADSRSISGRAGNDGVHEKLRGFQLSAFGYDPRNADRKCAREKQPCRERVHRDTRQKNDRLCIFRRAGEAPFRMRLAMFAEKPHEPAARYPIERIFGLFQFAKKERPWRISDAKFINFHFEELRGNEVPQLVRDDEEDQYPYY